MQPLTASELQELRQLHEDAGSIHSDPYVVVLEMTAVQLWELLREVYEQVGNHRPPAIRHALTPGLRDRIRDVVYGKKP